ncbi:hypothetical protein BC941DRAFT_473790 [Chlamydoabsidia padenii]|nr:hypothetical protein BC941DRAFT_473790 [Chlamydoabsidia padenii]
MNTQLGFSLHWSSSQLATDSVVMGDVILMMTDSLLKLIELDLNVAKVKKQKQNKDIRRLESGIHVEPSTPGHVYDTVRQKSMRTHSTSKMLTLDKADELLNVGFQRITLMTFIATFHPLLKSSYYLPLYALTLTQHFMTDPIRILLFVAIGQEEWKFDTLCDTSIITQAVTFCNTLRKVGWLTEKMREVNFTVSAMHGGMSQKECDAIINEFSQVERIGCSGWFGRKSVVINIVMNDDCTNIHGAIITKDGAKT